MTDILVLGAGMVGTCTALHLAKRGMNVTLADLREPGRETSFGNGGIIQSEAVEPTAFPRDWNTILAVALGRRTDVKYHLRTLPDLVRPLTQYWRHSSPERLSKIARDWMTLIVQARAEHDVLINDAHADNLISRKGYRWVFRSEAALDAALAKAERLHTQHGINFAAEDGPALARAEPGIKVSLKGALRWTDPWTVNDPGELVARYAAHFSSLGGRFVQADARTLTQSPNGWSLSTEGGTVTAEQVVIALGPWSGDLLKGLGYKIPLFAKRGYHQHYSTSAPLNSPIIDKEIGYLLAPMAQGVRLCTGVEFAKLGSPETPVQLRAAEQFAGQLVDLGEPVGPLWSGYRPTMVDMKPVMGRASSHKGLWFNFGHGHQGFTLGALSGHMLADMIEGKQPIVDPTPFAPARFGA